MRIFESPIAILKRRAESHGDDIAFRVLRNGRKRFDSFQPLSHRDFYGKTVAIAAYLQSLHLKSGARIAVWGKNSVDWLAADWAIMSCGFVSVPLYPQTLISEVQFILKDSGTSLVITDEKHDEISCPQILISDLEELSGSEDLSKSMALRFIQPPLDFERVATIIYTSGTSGQPKGVLHSLQNGFLAIESANQRMKVTRHDTLFSYLPLSHIAERVLIQWGSLITGASVAILDRVERLMIFLPQAEPTVFLAVPRVWDTIATRIKRDLDSRQNAGSPKSWLRFFPRSLKPFFIRRAIREKLGFKKTRLFLSGSAKLNPETLRQMLEFGIPISEAYGLTETMGVTCINQRHDGISSVGTPFPSVEVKVATDGEILVRAPFYFLGYHNLPEESGLSFSERWFHTGDIGEIDSKGRLAITDRKKNLFKTSSGKYIAPQAIEILIKQYDAIHEAIVLGEDKPHCVALLSLPPDFSDDRALEAHFKAVNKQLAPHEQIKALGCIRSTWSVDSGEMTPTYKLKRRVIEERFQPQIQQLFESSRFLSHF